MVLAKALCPAGESLRGVKQYLSFLSRPVGFVWNIKMTNYKIIIRHTSGEKSGSLRSSDSSLELTRSPSLKDCSGSSCEMAIAPSLDILSSPPYKHESDFDVVIRAAKPTCKRGERVNFARQQINHKVKISTVVQNYYKQSQFRIDRLYILTWRSWADNVLSFFFNNRLFCPYERENITGGLSCYIQASQNLPVLSDMFDKFWKYLMASSWIVRQNVQQELNVHQ